MITCILMLNVVYGGSFHSFVSRITLQLPCVKSIPCRVTLKQRTGGRLGFIVNPLFMLI